MIPIREEAMDIQDRLMSSDVAVVREAEKDLERFMEKFYDENKDMMAPQQHETAKKDFGYFIALIETAIGYYSSEGEYVRKAYLH